MGGSFAPAQLLLLSPRVNQDKWLSGRKLGADQEQVGVETNPGCANLWLSKATTQPRPDRTSRGPESGLHS